MDESKFYEFPDPIMIAPLDSQYMFTPEGEETDIWVPVLDHKNTKYSTDFTGGEASKVSFTMSFKKSKINVKPEYLNPLLITNIKQRDHFVNYWGWFKEFTVTRNRICSYDVMKEMEKHIDRTVTISEKFFCIVNKTG